MQKNLLRIFIIATVTIAATILLAFVATSMRAQMAGADAAAGQSAAGTAAVAADETQPALALSNMNGEVVDLQRLQGGKTILINYWATWCPPCISEIPSLLQVKALRQSDHFDIVFISLDFPKDPAALKAQMKRIGLEDLDTLYMTDARQWSLLNGRGLPISVLVAPGGRIISRFVGGMDWMSEAGVNFLKDVPPKP